MADRNIGTLSYKITGDSSSLDKNLTKSNKEVKGFGKSITDVGKLLKGAAFAGAVVFGAKKVADLSVAVINAASDAEETGNKFSVVFSDISEAAEAAATNLSENFGLSSVAAQTLLSDTGDLLTGFGFTQESALGLSEQVNELAVDLASFTNFSGGAQGASEALTKALLGERESVKSLGISILEADVQAKVLEQSQQGITFETERQAKAFATLAIAQEQSKNAIGDFERSADSYANRVRTAEAATEDLKVALGESLLPVASDAVFIYGELVDQIAEFIGAINEVRRLERTDDSDLTIDERAQKYRGLNAEIEDNIEFLREDLAIKRQQASTSEGRIRDLENEIQALINQRTLNNEILRGIEFEKTALAAKTKEEKEAARIEAERSEIRAEALRIENEYIKFIEDEYAKTEEARLEQLISERDLILENIDGYGGLREEQLLLIELKNEEIEALKESIAARDEDLSDDEAYFDERVALARGYAQMRQSIELDALEQQRENAAAEQALLIARGQAYSSLFGSLSSLITAFGAQSAGALIAVKAFSSAEALINSYLAFTQVIADPTLPFFVKIPSAAAVLASGLAQQINIASTPIPSFQDGGFVPGSSFTGDNVRANLNSGELVLNADQQRNILALANGGGGGQTINLVVDGKTLATAVVNNVNNGKGGTISKRVVK